MRGCRQGRPHVTENMWSSYLWLPLYMYTVAVISNSTRYSQWCGSMPSIDRWLLDQMCILNQAKCQGAPKCDIWSGLELRGITTKPSRLNPLDHKRGCKNRVRYNCVYQIHVRWYFYYKFWVLLCVVAVRVGHTSLRICGRVTYDCHCICIQ